MASLLPSIRYRVVTDAGAPIPGAKVYTYAAGTSTPKASYTSSAASVANTNPVIADARGEVLMWLSGAYKIVIRDADDNLIDEEDNVVDLTSGGTFATPTFTGTVTYSGSMMTWSGNPTHSGNHTFSGNATVGGNFTVNGNTAIGNASGDTLTIAPNAVTWTNGATHSGAHTFSGAVTAASTLAVTGAATFNGNVTLGNASADTVTVTGTLAGQIASGKWSPTFTAGTNVTGTPALVNNAYYIRIGSVVKFAFHVNVDPTATNTFTQFSFTLPVATNFSNLSQLVGSLARNATASNVQEVGSLSSDDINDLGVASWYCGADASMLTLRVSGMYEIL